jgi:eukaryotic-like serine/threonine-protein kinase
VSEHPPIPGYERLELLGRNGHLIYRARQSATGQLVRLNVVHSGGEFGQEVADGLRHQAQVLAALDHPNIQRLIEVGEAQGHGFFSALEYVEGASLAETFRHQTLTDHDELVRVVREVAAALDHAHGRNVVHGNVHPEHILLDRTGHVSVVGFGEVWPRYPEVMVLGNPHFLAPEQIGGLDKTVPQTDVYALAEVVFWLLSGSFPFQGAEGTLQLLERKCSGPAPSLRGRGRELPCGADVTLQKAMALRPEERFRSAGKFVEELDRTLRVGDGEGKKWWQFWR